MVVYNLSEIYFQSPEFSAKLGRIQEFHLDAELYWSSSWVEERVSNEVMKNYFSFAARKNATVPPGVYLNSLNKLFNTTAPIKQLELR